MSVQESGQLEPVVTDRDNALLVALAKCSCLTTAQAKEVAYGEVPWYVYKRLKVLERRGLIRRSGHKIFITQKGLSAAGYGGITPRQTRRNDPRTEAGDIFIALAQSGWEFISSKIAKQEYNLNRGDMFSGMIRGRGRQLYPVYLLSRYPRKATVSKMRSEIRNFPARQYINGAVVLCRGRNSAEAFGTAAITQVSRLMVLQLDAACSVLQRFSLEEGFRGLYEPALEGYKFHASNKTFSDYVVADKSGSQYYVAELLTGDLNVRFTAGAYLKKQYKLEGRRLILFCFESQLPLVSRYFKGEGCQRVFAVTEDWKSIREVRTLPPPESEAGDENDKGMVQQCFDWV